MLQILISNHLLDMFSATQTLEIRTEQENVMY